MGSMIGHALRAPCSAIFAAVTAAVLAPSTTGFTRSRKSSDLPAGGTEPVGRAADSTGAGADGDSATGGGGGGAHGASASTEGAGGAAGGQNGFADSDSFSIPIW